VFRTAAVVLVLAVSSLPSLAQDTIRPVERIPLVLTLDQDRLFNQSAFGRKVVEDLNARSQALAAENRQIELDLAEEEQALTDQRPSLEASAFRDLADAFDNKVERIRKEQAQKAVDLNAWIESEQQRFFTAALPIVTELTRELGAVVVLDRRFTLIALDQADVTNLAILRVDQTLGDGSAEAE
jgi:Skp family chaperone for outer membrane proteins